jgi:hypothetical protein
MSLPRAELDYIAAPRRARAAGFALLALSLACAGIVLERYRSAKLETAAIESARALLPGERRAAPSARGADEEIRQADAVVRQLALPWAAMIHAVEDAASPDIAVMQMEPDARDRKLRIGAEAKDEAAMLEYLRRLGRAAALTDVQLASHQVQLEDARRPIQFAVLARLK